ncbi:MAG TPA: hypothetical protein VFJ49_01490, partial [Methyloceanibacter sp.]|nr:hypothetical protein [Methyloceanibacter sp.]
ADTGVAIPDLSQLEWPFRHKAEHAPTILVSGSTGANDLVSAPPETGTNALSNEAHSVRLPLPEDKEVGWRPHHLFRGATPNAQLMGAHVSVLSSNHSPHPPLPS